MPDARVLVVEDEFLIRLTLVEALADEGITAVEAATGEEALSCLEKDDAIELILTDLHLPGALDGLGLARAARRRQPDLPIVFMTGRPDQLAGFTLSDRDARIAKPYLPSQVTAAVRRLLGR